ncbi:MAG: helix-turn-helix domain-containing protein [Hypericibacter sp.]
MIPPLTASDVPKEPAIRRAWIIFQLRIRGWSLSDIAREMGIAPQSARGALLEPSAHVERALAKKLGLRVQDLFHDRYDPTGRRLHRTRGPDPSRRGDRRNVDSQGAA